MGASASAARSGATKAADLAAGDPFPEGPRPPLQQFAPLSRVIHCTTTTKPPMLDLPAEGPPEPTDDASAAELVAQLYDELRDLAAARLRALPPGQTLQATALVNEAFLRIQSRGDQAWQGRRHFFGAAARAMHDILVERARARQRLKRGGNQQPVPLDPDLQAEALALPEPDIDVLALSEALTRMAKEDPRGHELVMLRFFAGLENAEVAAVLGTSERTVGRDWQFARAWLKDAMST